MTRLPTTPAVGGLQARGSGHPSRPDPVRLAGLLARAWLEVRAGRRPFAQLTPMVSPAARQRLASQLPASPIDAVRAAARQPPARVRRLISSTPAPGVREVTVLVDHGERTSAIAVRMERHRGAWRAVELTAPEAGLPPLPTASIFDDRRPRDAFDEIFEEVGELLPPHLRR